MMKTFCFLVEWWFYGLTDHTLKMGLFVLVYLTRLSLELAAWLPTILTGSRLASWTGY